MYNPSKKFDCGFCHGIFKVKEKSKKGKLCKRPLSLYAFAPQKDNSVCLRLGGDLWHGRRRTAGIKKGD